MHEHWLPVVGYEGIYQVSNLGRVTGIDVAFRKFDYDRGGYQRIVLHKCGAKKRFLVHILVTAAFLGPKPPGMTVNHKNGIKADNRLENLEYLTQGENEQHSFDVLGRKSPGGSKHWNHKLTEDDVRAIRALRPTHKLAELSAKFGVNIGEISAICNRRIWRNVLP